MLFQVGDSHLGLPVSDVREILPLPPLWRPPGTPPIIAGVLNRRGTALPVLRLDRLFGRPERRPGLYSPLVVLAPPLPAVALLADRVADVAALTRPAPADPLLPAAVKDAVAGLFAHGTMLIHLMRADRLLTAIEQGLLDDFQAMAQRRLGEWRPEGHAP